MSLPSFSCAVAGSTNALLVRDVDGQYRVASADEILSQAWGVLAERIKPGVTLSSPQDVKDYLRLEIGLLEHEVFCVVFLDAQHRVIELRQMFRGTVTQTSVYPREVVKEALQLNAAAVILAHSVARHRMRLMCLESLCARAIRAPGSALTSTISETHNGLVRSSMTSPSTRKTGDCLCWNATSTAPSP